MAGRASGPIRYGAMRSGDGSAINLIHDQGVTLGVRTLSVHKPPQNPSTRNLLKGNGPKEQTLNEHLLPLTVSAFHGFTVRGKRWHAVGIFFDIFDARVRSRIVKKPRKQFFAGRVVRLIWLGYGDHYTSVV